MIYYACWIFYQTYRLNVNLYSTYKQKVVHNMFTCLYFFIVNKISLYALIDDELRKERIMEGNHAKQ